MSKLFNNTAFLWAFFVLISGCIFFSYAYSSFQAGQGNLLMPLDDVYIHFQYARQMALGHPYHYNLSDPATSGATSFIYPYLLAFGYLIGFQGLWLGLWAMLIGTICLIASLWAVYRLSLHFTAPNWLSIIMSLSFALTGAMAWHFMSGMETGLMICLCLWTLLLLLEKRLYAFVIVASFLSLTRPEAGAMAALASATMFLRLWQTDESDEKHNYPRSQMALLLLPIFAIAIQPLLNLLITGTTVATGNQAKSILATMPQDWGRIISRIFENFSRMWLELLTGYDGFDGHGWYLPFFIGIFGLSAILILFFKKNYRLVALMLVAWLLVMTIAISSLDTAFWHFKRYQMPLFALLFPLAQISLQAIMQKLPYGKPAIYLYSLVLVLFAGTQFIQFLNYYTVNVAYVYQQPFQMALWLQANTPEDARIAVHDVGLMRYLGERETLDIVGLTTANAASYWRNGPGSVAEFIIDERPDYIANYGRGHGYGLAYLADTSLYVNQLASFTVENWQRELNVALAADSQAIYEPDWDALATNNQTIEHSQYNIFPGQTSQVLDVANIGSEQTHNYQWQTRSNSFGFNTEVREMPFSATRFYSSFLLDAYRLINVEERFSFSHLNPQEDALLITRVHTAAAATLDIFVNDNFLVQRVIPANAGHWLDIPTLIPREMLAETIDIRIIPHFYAEDAFYMPALHRITQGQYPHFEPITNSLASFQENAVQLLTATIEFDGTETLSLSLDFANNGAANGDYLLFVHLYGDINQAPLAQSDDYFMGMPLGNWLMGNMSDTIRLNLANIPNGTYSLALGFYNRQNPLDRVVPESNRYEISTDGRLWLGEVEINR